MARIAMECKCGWKFFLASTTQGWEAGCPNCGQAVRIPGRKAGQKVFETAGHLAAEKEKGWKMARLAIGLGAVMVVAIIVLVVVMSGSSPSPSYEDGPITDMPRSTGSGLRSGANLPPPPPPPPPSDPSNTIRPPTTPRVDTGALRHEVRQTTWMINIAGLVAETLRFRGMKEDRDRVTARAAEWDNKLRATVARVEEAGEKAQVEDYLRPGDTIVGFAQKELSTFTSAGAADLLASWLGTFKANSMEQVIVSRGDKRIVVYVDIPEVTKELLELARTPTGEIGKGIGGTAPAAASLAPVAPASLTGVVPEDLVRAVQAGFAALPEGYGRMLPSADRTRLDPLLQRKLGTQDDMDFLRNRILGQAIPAFEKEAALVRAKAAELDAKVKGTTAVDVIHFKDGRKVEGQILSETETEVKIKARLGTMPAQKAEIRLIERGKGAGLEFPDKLKAAQGKVEALAPLLSWCREKKLALEAEYVSYLILALDPANEPARANLSLKRPLGFQPAPAPPVAAAPPPPPPPVAPSAVDSAKSEVTALAMDAAATEVLKSHKGLTEVIEQMRTRSGPYRYGFPPPVPVKSSRAMTLIGNPLTFSSSTVTVDVALELGNWWGGLAPEDRKDFARFFGLWCCYHRTVGR